MFRAMTGYALCQTTDPGFDPSAATACVSLQAAAAAVVVARVLRHLQGEV